MKYQDPKTGISMHYEIAGNGQPVLLLHGWGCSSKTMQPLFEHLKTEARIIMVDLPGFGLSDLPPSAWNSADYADFLVRFSKELNLESLILMGHSFGGKLSLLLASKLNIAKIVLFASAGIRAKRNLKYYFKVWGYKTAKKGLQLPVIKYFTKELLEKLKDRLGSADYKNSKGLMRQTLIKVVNEDIRTVLPAIKCPVLMFWGDQDRATPLADAELMAKLIPDAGLVKLEGSGHYAFLEQFSKVKTIIDYFLKT